MATPKFYGGDQGVAIFCYYRKHEKLPQAVIFATTDNEKNCDSFATIDN